MTTSSRDIVTTCGACGAELGALKSNGDTGWHLDWCPTIADRHGHARRVREAIDPLNAFHALTSACRAVLPYMNGTTQDETIRGLLEWATAQEESYEKQLDEIFPFHKGRK